MSILEFSDFRDFIRFRVSQQITGKHGRKKSNLSRVARELGYATPSVLSMVIRGSRIPSGVMCENMSNHWKLSSREREYFQLLVRLERQKRAGKDFTDTLEKIRKLRGNAPSARPLAESEFSMISEWHCIVVRHLVGTKGFREDPNWISRVMRRKISPRQAQEALDRMLELGILKRDPESAELVIATKRFETTHDIPSVAIRLHQKGMIERALEAIEEQPADKRFFNTLTFNMDRKQLPELKAKLLNVLKEVAAEQSQTQADSIFQLNVQLFEHLLNPEATDSAFRPAPSEVSHAKQ